MAKFRGIFKRRSRLTGRKVFAPVNSPARRSDLFGGEAEKYYSAHPMTNEQREEAINEFVGQVPSDDGDVHPLGGTPIAGENWVKFFALILSRLRRWFRGFWSAPRWTHPNAWLLVSRQQNRL